MTASLHVLHAGYVGAEGPEGMRVGSTVTYATEGDTHIVIDPGMVSDRALILDPLRALGVDPAEVIAALPPSGTKRTWPAAISASVKLVASSHCTFSSSAKVEKPRVSAAGASCET